MVEVGDKAPDFRLQGVSSDGEIKTYTLDELTDDSGLVIAVYAYDFSPRCTDQLCQMDDVDWLTVPEHLNVVGISGDGPYSHRQFIEEKKLTYPLLSDTSQDLIAQFGVLNKEYDEMKEVPQRSLFLIGPNQRVRYKWVAEDNWDQWETVPLDEMREHIDAIEELV